MERAMAIEQGRCPPEFLIKLAAVRRNSHAPGEAEGFRRSANKRTEPEDIRESPTAFAFRILHHSFYSSPSMHRVALRSSVRAAALAAAPRVRTVSHAHFSYTHTELRHSCNFGDIERNSRCSCRFTLVRNCQGWYVLQCPNRTVHN